MIRSDSLFLALAVLALAGCDRPVEPTALDVPVYFTCDTQGRLEPCGCFSGQFGGLTRLKTVLDAEAPPDALRVDVGDAISGTEDYDLIQHRYLLQAFERMKYDAMNIGHREARLSAAQLHELKQTSPVPILSANLRDRSTGQPIFDAYRIVERGGHRIGLIGIVSPVQGGEQLGEGLEIESMEAALSRCLPELKSKSDVIVLLAFADNEEMAGLAQQFFELDVILGGKVRQPAQSLRKENRSYVYFVTNESRALGFLKLRLEGQERAAVVAHEIKLLHDRIPQDRSFREMVQAYREEVRRAELAVDDPEYASADMVTGVRAGADYVGSERCIECHPTAGEIWEKTGHAHAFTTLVKRNADADPKCIGCHVVGFARHSGYRREFGAEKLTDVGCESCHGPGSLHVRQQSGDELVSFKYRPLGSGDCQVCHYGEFSRPFDWDEFWPLIKHGNEPEQTASRQATEL